MLLLRQRDLAEEEEFNRRKTSYIVRIQKQRHLVIAYLCIMIQC
jgi:hypothetical protein